MRINYSLNGDGDRALFFIHGWASDQSVWRRQVEEFKKDFQVICVDLRGHGKSSWEDTDNLLKSFTEDILELCGKLKLEHINFIGWSLAGYILFNLYKKVPELINSLTFITSTPKFLNAPDYNCGITDANLNLLRKKLSTDFDAALKEFRLYMFSEKERANYDFPEIWKIFMQIPSPHKTALSLGLELLEKADFRAELSKINKSTLFIAGENDLIVPAAAAQFMQHKINGSQQVIFDGSGHLPFLTQAEKFNQVLREWINKK